MAARLLLPGSEPHTVEHVLILLCLLCTQDSTSMHTAGLQRSLCVQRLSR